MKVRLILGVGLTLALGACGGAPAPIGGTTGGRTGPAPAVDTTGATAIPDAPQGPVVNPETARRLDEAHAAAASGDLDGARRLYERIAAEDSTAAEPVYNLGVLAERQGDDVGARRYYKQALDVRPDFGPAVTAIANVMLRKGDASGALAFAEGQLARAPESSGLRNAVSRLRLLSGDVDGAIRDATLVLRADEKNVDAMKVLAGGYFRQKKFELAVAILRSAEANDPADPEIHAKLARAHLALDEKPRARLALEKAVALPGGGSAEVYNDLGLLYHEAGDYAGAEGMFRQALARHPQFLAAQVNLGNSLKGQQKYAEADAAMKRALELGPGSGDVLFNLGILYLDGQIPGIEPLARLQQAIDFFNRYKSAAGARPANDPVEQYIAEANKRVVVEQKKAESARKDPKPAPPSAPPPDEGGEK
ncbi:tetratricopeptide repeat protein [Myxococcota bacterium]|nr:tetratricopeptide repeat protein [Myxococcota bacterium]